MDAEEYFKAEIIQEAMQKVVTLLQRRELA